MGEGNYVFLCLNPSMTSLQKNLIVSSRSSKSERRLKGKISHTYLTKYKKTIPYVDLSKQLTNTQPEHLLL